MKYVRRHKREKIVFDNLNAKYNTTEMNAKRKDTYFYSNAEYKKNCNA